MSNHIREHYERAAQLSHRAYELEKMDMQFMAQVRMRQSARACEEQADQCVREALAAQGDEEEWWQ